MTEENVVEIILRARDEATPAFQRVREEIRQHQEAINTLRMYYQQQNLSIHATSRAFRNFASIFRKAQSMLTSYQVSMIRIDQLQNRLAEAQRVYNEALRTGDTERAGKALEDLREAHLALKQAQVENVLMLSTFIGQIPAFIASLMSARLNLMMLQMQANQTSASLATMWSLVPGIGWVTLGVSLGMQVGAMAAYAQANRAPPRLQRGGVVTRTGLAIVEKGEHIIPAKAKGEVHIHIQQLTLAREGLSPEAWLRSLGRSIRSYTRMIW